VDESTKWYLVETVADARADPLARTEYQAKQARLGHFGGVLAAFRYLQAITEGEQNAWFRRMLLALGYDLPDPPAAGSARAVFVGDPSTRVEPPEAHVAPTNLVRKIHAARQIDFYGGQLQIEAVEIYDVAVVIRWKVEPDLDVWKAFPVEAAELEADLEGVTDGWAVDELRQKAGQAMRRLLRSSELTDDAGTTYVQSGGSHRTHWGIATGSTSQGEAEFRPAPPTVTKKLKWMWLNTTIAIPLR
jgi:hypothetical protein